MVYLKTHNRRTNRYNSNLYNILFFLFVSNVSYIDLGVPSRFLYREMKNGSKVWLVVTNVFRVWIDEKKN